VLNFTASNMCSRKTSDERDLSGVAGQAGRTVP
jgi:hypothetical protein